MTATATATNTYTNPFSDALSTGTEVIELPRWRGQGRRISSAPTSTVSEDNDTKSYTWYSPSVSLTPTSTLNPLSTQSTNPCDLTPVRILVWTRTVFWSDQTISLAPTPINATSTPLYHASTHELNLWSPDIILHRSSVSDPKASIIAAAHFRFSRHARLGFGNDLDKLNGKDTHDGDIAWEPLRNTSCWLQHWQYDFCVPCTGEFDHIKPMSTKQRRQFSSSLSSSATDPNEGIAAKDADQEVIQSSSPTTRRHFRLVRTHAASDGVSGWLGWASFQNYKLIDLSTGEVIGVYLSDDMRSLTRMGELRLFKDLAEDVQRGVVLGVGVVLEKHIRRMRRAGKSSCGGGGGGGGGGDGG